MRISFFLKAHPPSEKTTSSFQGVPLRPRPCRATTTRPRSGRSDGRGHGRGHDVRRRHVRGGRRAMPTSAVLVHGGGRPRPRRSASTAAAPRPRSRTRVRRLRDRGRASRPRRPPPPPQPQPQPQPWPTPRPQPRPLPGRKLTRGRVARDEGRGGGEEGQQVEEEGLHGGGVKWIWKRKDVMWRREFYSRACGNPEDARKRRVEANLRRRVEGSLFSRARRVSPPRRIADGAAI